MRISKLSGGKAIPRFCLFLFFAFAFANASQASDQGEFQRQLLEVLEDGDGKALAAAAVQGDRVLWKGAVGIADVDLGTKATEETIFQLASVSKLMTGLVACELAAQGLLHLDQDVLALAPELPIDNPFDGQPITVRHMLEHTSGIQEIIPRWYDERYAPILPVIDLMKNTLPRVVVRWPPGQRTAYSNFNYAAINHLIEKVTGEPFDRAIERRIFAPLGMTTATFRAHKRNFSKEGGHQLAKGYRSDSLVPLGPVVGVYRVTAGMAASANDLERLLRMLVQDGTFEGREVISSSALDLMESIETGPAGRFGLTLGHGAGVVGREFEGHVFYGHNGIVDGFMASLFYSRKSRFGYAVMTNAHPIPNAPSLSRARRAIMGQFFVEPRQLSPRDKTLEAKAWPGFFVNASSRFAQLAIVDRLADAYFLSKEPGGISLREGLGKPKLFFPVAFGAYRSSNATYADTVHGLLDDGRSFLFKAPTAFYLNESFFSYAVQLALLLAALLAVTSMPLYFIYTGIKALKGIRPNLLAVLLLTTFGCLALAIVIALSLKTSEVALQRNGFTVTFFLSTLSFFAAALTSLVLAVRTSLRVRRGESYYQIFAALGLAILAVVLWRSGFIAIKLWANASSLPWFWPPS